MPASAFCRLASASASLAFSLKSRESLTLTLIWRRSCFAAPLANGRAISHAGQDLGHVARLHLRPAPAELAGHVQQAAEVAGQQRARAGLLDILGFLGDEPVGNLRIFDAEGPAEAAA